MAEKYTVHFSRALSFSRISRASSKGSSFARSIYLFAPFPSTYFSFSTSALAFLHFLSSPPLPPPPPPLRCTIVLYMSSNFLLRYVSMSRLFLPTYFTASLSSFAHTCIFTLKGHAIHEIIILYLVICPNE